MKALEKNGEVCGAALICLVVCSAYRDPKGNVFVIVCLLVRDHGGWKDVERHLQQDLWLICVTLSFFGIKNVFRCLSLCSSFSSLSFRSVAQEDATMKAQRWRNFRRSWFLLLVLFLGSDAQGIGEPTKVAETSGVERKYLDQDAAINVGVEQNAEVEPTTEEEREELQTYLEARAEAEREEEREAEAKALEEEEEFTDVDLAEALMLLGGITFIMMLFYLVNDEDQDMRYYSWSVISATLSIFAAVLIFSGVNQTLHTYVLPENKGHGLRLLWAALSMLIYFSLLQLGTAYDSWPTWSVDVSSKIR